MKTKRTILSSAAAAALAALLVTTAGNTPALGEFATVRLPAVDDAYVDSAAPNTNFGGSLNTYLGDRASQLGGVCASFYQFDMSSVPANAEILNAELWLCKHEKYGTPQQTFTVTVHLVTTPGWSESVVTFNAPPGYASQPSSSSTGTFNPPGWEYWNVTADVAGERPSRTLIGWAALINPAVQWAWLNFYSSEQVPMPDYRPMLEITYGGAVPAESTSWSEVKALFR